MQRGDQYVLRAGQLICRNDFEKELYMMQSFGGMDQRCEQIMNATVELCVIKGSNSSNLVG